MFKFAGKTAICAMSAALFFANSGITASATGLTSVLPAAGLGLELEEGQSVKVVKEEAINKAKQNSISTGESVSDNELFVLENTSITLDKEIVEPIDTEALLEAAAKANALAEEEKFKSLVIAQVNNYVNVRDLPSEDGEIVGKLYDESVGHFIEEENGWYKITSGNCTGYVKAEYCVTGEDAVELAKEVGVRIATVTTTTLKVRSEANIESLIKAKGFEECGFKIIATGGTHKLITENGIKAEKIAKLQEGRPNILDAITNGEIDIIINTPDDKQGNEDDSYIRKNAVRKRVFYVTTMAAAKATVEGIKAIKNGGGKGVKSLQQFHSEIE